MRTIAHISDLHFGTEDAQVAEALAADIMAKNPTVVAVSGDLTQRARRGQFAAARDYLKRLPFPAIVVPGNHDIPLFNLWRRFRGPLDGYRHSVSSQLAPSYVDEEIAILGMNTARSLTWKSGWLSLEQMAFIRQFFASIPATVCKILVTHHPFIQPTAEAHENIMCKLSVTVPAIDASGVDLLLAGHLHHGYTGDVLHFHPRLTRSILVAQAGTAISRRLRGEPNCYNFLTVSRNAIRIEIRLYNGQAFESHHESVYQLDGKKWLLAPEAAIRTETVPP